MRENKWTAVMAFVCGAAVGALAGIYFSPKSGKEMREDLGDMLSEGERRARKAGEKVTRRAQEMAEHVQRSVSDLADAGVRAARKINPS
jgi:gas vesicle protein